MNIWIINPFDQLPNETDVPLRYWALCRTFAQQGHEVIWWSSNFSHLTKSKRPLCPDTDGFAVRLIETPPYTKNISLARLKNHRAFANGFYSEAMAALQSGELQAPDQIVVSLPPLGVAEQAFRIRDYVRECKCAKVGTYVPNGTTRPGAKRTGPGQDPKAARVEPSHLNTFAPSHSSKAGSPSIISHPPSQQSCQVVVDIMDAWPETFYQALPKLLRKALGPILLAPMHRSAKRAYQGADKISAVGQSYLDLAKTYLTTPPTNNQQPATPTHLCYHGTDLERFAQKPEGRRQQAGLRSSQPSSLNKQQTTNNKQPLKAVYLGAMGSGYDLQTIIEVAARWKAEGRFPFQIHFAGTGPQLEKLKTRSKELGLTSGGTTVCPSGCSVSSAISHQPSVINDSERIIFHGFLQKDAINRLLLSADLALVPNSPDSLVACPYKAGEYAAASLPMLSCLGGELGNLLKQWDAGSEYKEGDAASLQAAFENYVSDPEVLKQQSLNARNMAEALFDREKTYAELAAFILANDSADTQ